ncbi:MULTISPECIES: UMP kinase [unclassified Brevibacterium]|uniref:UMP kinase n=1 Tax=unclassified Brevibacterium TaxID=2614124 RepID=UPI0008A2B958|nr:MULTISPECIES: UMP kinase [unclassified Brevibacterium]OFL64816.1 UMP kinase [Brevibacterium sp. HMSC063G07]OFS26558.1 UMP kinase [Brevibacterium sp. HMSC07C04]
MPHTVSESPKPEATHRRRVLLKLSGEVFGGGSVGVNPDVVASVAREIAPTVGEVEMSIVVGGGNFFRGAELQNGGMDRTRADYMGMLGTVMNCLALQDFLEQLDVDTRVQTAIPMPQVAESYIPRRAMRHMQKDRVVIFGAGAGLPFFSTDTVAAQRALEIHADEVLVAKNGVDGVYTADPKSDPTAQKLDSISYQDALQRGLKVVDATAFSLCMDNNVAMRVFGMEGEGNLRSAIMGENIGTVLSA